MIRKFSNKLIQGTLLLTATGFITRIIGFVYRIFLANILGTNLLGIYQLVFPVYGICFTIYGAGIQTAISQLIASNVGESAQKARKDLAILKWGLLASLTLSLSLSAIIYLFAEPIAARFLLEPACSPYLRLLCLLFPFCGTSACINGYFYGKKEAKVPAVTQIVEQLVRVASVFVLCMALSATGETGCRLAILGLVLGEAASCFYNCFHLYLAICRAGQKASSTQTGKMRKKQAPALFRTKSSGYGTIKQNKIASSLLFLAFTLTTTKLVISILHSVEAVFIPAALKKFGCSPEDALSIYGILSGIALPFILFPSTITNSFAVMLLPAIAQAQAERSDQKIKNYVTLSGKYSLFIGYLFTCIFLIFGKDFGTVLFHSSDAGTYIYALSWLCPFMYLSTTFTSIINGLGKTQLTFLITAVSLLVKIYFLVFLVPRYGIQAYLAGSLISYIAMTVLEGLYLNKYMHWSILNFFVVPGICLTLLGTTLKKLYTMLPVPKSGLPTISVICAICLLICIGYLFVLQRLKCINVKDFL
jgi:stage V sporulation protein B